MVREWSRPHPPIMWTEYVAELIEQPSVRTTAKTEEEAVANLVRIIQNSKYFNSYSEGKTFGISLEEFEKMDEEEIPKIAAVVIKDE